MNAIASSAVDWTQGVMGQHIVKLLDVISTLCPEYTVVSDSGHLLPPLPGNGQNIIVDPQINRTSLPDLLGERLKIPNSERLIVVDALNPLLTKAAVCDFIQTTSRNDTPSVSIDLSERSPFYFIRLQQVAASGSLHLFDPRYPVDAYTSFFPSVAATFPFYFNWAQFPLPILSKQAVFARLAAKGRISWQRLEDLPNNGRPDCLFIHAGDNLARIVMPSHEAQGSSLPETALTRPALLAFSKGGKIHFTTEMPTENGELEIIPFTPQGPQPNRRQIIQQIDDSWCCPVSPGKDTTGFLFHVTEPSREGVPAISRKFDMPKLPQKKGSGQITCRQQIPDIFRITDDFAVGTIDELRRLPKLLSAGKIRGFRLPCRSIHVNTPVDLMRVKAEITQGLGTEVISCIMS